MRASTGIDLTTQGCVTSSTTCTYIRKGEPGPGDRVHAFDLETTDGGRLRSSDLAAQGRPAILVFGSRTCPVTESAAEGLRRLHAVYGHRARFVMVQVREAHPGGSIPQPKTPQEKLRHAVDLKSHHRLPYEVAVDDLDGTLHRSLGSRPNSAYVIDPSGTILFRAHWANETKEIGKALSAIVSGKSPRLSQVTRTFHAVTQAVGYMSPVLSAAGRGARLDTWKVAPPMSIMMTLADFFFFLPRHQRGLPATALMIGSIVAIVGSIIRSLS